VLTGIEPLRAAVRYSGPEGASFEDFPYHQSVLHRARGDYEELPGWDEDVTGARTLADLPANARAFLEFIEQRLDIPVVMVGVGPGREQMIWTDAAESVHSRARVA